MHRIATGIGVSAAASYCWLLINEDHRTQIWKGRQAGANADSDMVAKVRTVLFPRESP